jgi:hypothetical protein
MTTDNGYIAWAPSNMYGRSEQQVEQGDMIAIVLGCSTLIAIRPVGEAFQILGETFVQGLMDGKAMRDLENGEHKVRKLSF